MVKKMSQKEKKRRKKRKKSAFLFVWVSCAQNLRKTEYLCLDQSDFSLVKRSLFEIGFADTRDHNSVESLFFLKCRHYFH